MRRVYGYDRGREAALPRINWASPLAQGLTSAIRFGQYPYDPILRAFNGSNPAHKTGSIAASTEWGESTWVGGSTPTNATYDWTTTGVDAWRPTGVFSFAVCYRCRSLGTNALSSNFVTDGWGITQRFGDGTLRCGVNASNAADSSGGFIQAGRLEVVVLATGGNGSTYELFHRGTRRIGPNNVTTTVNYAGTGPIGPGDRGQLNSSSNNDIFWIAMWNGKRLGQGEAQFLSANPFTFWEKQNARVFYSLPSISASVQYARPISDITAGSWLPSSGSDLYAMIDEA